MRILGTCSIPLIQFAGLNSSKLLNYKNNKKYTYNIYNFGKKANTFGVHKYLQKC